MSPLARSLLALFCAALLRTACATYPDYDPKHCTLITIGDRSGTIVIDRIWGPKRISPLYEFLNGQVDIPEIHRLGIELVEETVVVCSVWGLPPSVSAPAEGFSPVEVHSQNLIFRQDLFMTVYQSYRVVAPDPTVDSEAE